MLEDAHDGEGRDALCRGRRREQLIASVRKAERRGLPRAGRREVGGGQRRAGRGEPGRKIFASSPS